MFGDMFSTLMPRSTLKILCLAIGALLTASLASSEPRPKLVRGLVTDEADHPLPNVLIEWSCVGKEKPGPLETAKSGADGRFRLEARLEAGCKVKITSPGFSTRLVPIPDSAKRSPIDLGKISLRVSCSGPGVVCDEITPSK